MDTTAAPVTLEHVLARLTELEQANAALQDKVSTLERERTAARLPTGTHAEPPRVARTSRRTLLQMGGAAAATAAAVVLAGETSHGTVHAASAHADTIGFQQTISGFGNVAIEGDGTSDAIGVGATSDTAPAVYGFSGSNAGVSGASSSGYGVQGHSTSNYGVYGQAYGNDGVHGQSATLSGVAGISSSGVGVFGQSGDGDGVHGFSTNLSGVVGISTNYVGGYFSGGRAAINLQPAGTPGAPTTGAHSPGDLWLDSVATLWLCVGSGTPGSWARAGVVLPGYTGGVAHFLPAPIRIVDTRGGAPITNGGVPLAGGSTLVVQVTGTAVGGVSVPQGARGVLANLTALPFAGGDLTIWADGLPRPNASNLNYTPGINIANFVMSAVSALGRVDIYAHVGTTNVILDVAGFIA